VNTQGLKIVAAGVVALAGAGVAWRALSSGRSAPPQPPPATIEGVRFERLDSAEQIEAYLADFAYFTREQAREAVAELGAPSFAADQFSELVRRRLQSVLQPEQVDWRALAEAEGAELVRTGEGLPEALRERSLNWRSWWTTARFRAEIVVVRRLTKESMMPGDDFHTASRNPVRAMYPIPEDAPMYEATIPVMAPTSPGGSPRKHAYLGISYWWSAEESRWRPANITVYMGSGTADIVPPPM